MDELLNEITLVDTPYKTPLILQYERRNTLTNRLRTEFFGEDLNSEAITKVLDDLHKEMRAEFEASEKKLKAYSVKSYSSAVAAAEKELKFSEKSNSTELVESGQKVKETSENLFQRRKTALENKYTALTNVLNWLKDNGNTELTLEQLSEWDQTFQANSSHMWTSNLNKAEEKATKVPEVGLAEKQLDHICSSISSVMTERIKYEKEHKFNIPLEYKYMKNDWSQRIQAYFANDKFDHFSEQYDLRDRAYVEKDLALRVGEAVTAIYTGKLVLPGLKIGDYWAEGSTAPYKTAQELLETLGGFPFLGQNGRSWFLPTAMSKAYNNRKEKSEYDQKELIDDVMEHGNFEALKKLNDGRYAEEKVPTDIHGWFRNNAEPGLKNTLATYINDISAGKTDEKGEPVKWEWFKKLDEIKKSTKGSLGSNENTWRNTPIVDQKAEDALKNLQNRKEKLYADCSKGWLQKKFNAKIEDFWSGGLGVSQYRIQGNEENGIRGIQLEELEKTIAAHLCSAHPAYREKNKETSPDVLSLYHQPKLPINDKSIQETVDYFQEMLKSKYPNESASLKNVDYDRIKLFYDSAILNREAKLQAGGNDPNLNSYMQALKLKFELSDAIQFHNSDEADTYSSLTRDHMDNKASMISRIVSDKKKPKLNDDWFSYVKKLMNSNPQFKDTLEAAYTTPGKRKPDDNYMVSRFIVESGKVRVEGDLGLLKGGQPDLLSHEARLEKWKDEVRPEKVDMNALIRKEVESIREYKDGLWQINKDNEIVMGTGMLVPPEQYNTSVTIDQKTLKTIQTAGTQMIVKQDNINKDMAKQNAELIGVGRDANPTLSRSQMLSMLLEGVSGEKEPTQAKKNILNSAKSLKRGWFNTLFGLHINKAGSKLRSMLNDIAAKKDGDSITPEEMMNLNNTAKALKESIDHGTPLTGEKVKELAEIDQNRYELATKVIDTLEKKMLKGGLLFKKEAEELGNQLDAPTNLTM